MVIFVLYSLSDQITSQGPPLLPNLQNPAIARKLINRVRPAQMPPRPNLGAATSRNIDEIAPAKN